MSIGKFMAWLIVVMFILGVIILTLSSVGCEKSFRKYPPIDPDLTTEVGS